MPGLDITPRLPAGGQRIESYGEGGFKVAGQRYQGSIIVRPQETIAWPVGRADEIAEQTLAPVLAAVEAGLVLLIGCGRTFTPPPPALGIALRARGIGMEWMDTGAACRTFNVLLSEGRAVAAALIATP